MQIILRSSLGVLVLFAGLLAIVPILGPAPALAGTTTLITYYPAPHGDYAKLRLVPMSAPATPCNSGTMYVDSATGFMKFCDNSNGNGTGAWVNIWAAPPVNNNEVATKGYVDATRGGGCYVSYSGSCLSGFTNKGSAGSWGYCYWPGSAAFFRPPGGTCGNGPVSAIIGEAFVCCQQ